MLERYFLRPKTVDRFRALWLGPTLDRYVEWLAERQAASNTVQRSVHALIHFSELACARGATTWADLPSHVDPFVDAWMRSRGRWCRTNSDRSVVRSQARTPVEQLLRLIIPGFVGATRRLPLPFHTCVPGFFPYLEHERGLRRESIQRYVHHLRVFEGYLGRAGISQLADLSPTLLTTFLIESAQRLGAQSVQGRSGTLRVFLRYLHRQSVIATDLSRAVPRGRGYRHAGIPRAITWAEVEQVLTVVDRRAPVGKRDYAVLRLLATYGLRAREVAALHLDDIDWHRAQIRVSGRKGGHSTIYPLSTGVGEAIADYLRVRPAVSDRVLFHTVQSPFVPVRHYLISGLAARYLRAAGIKAPRSGSHTFRHACVQRLVDADVPFKVIGDYVGHRRAASTQVYGKVAIHLLRQLALGDGEEAL